jgi:ATP synthase protein I
MADEEDLKSQIERQAERMKRAERERRTLLGQTVYLGTLGLLLVLPIVAGAYIGAWLDGLVPAYSSRWTVSLIVVGVFVGAVNAYLFIKE